jgi:leucyl aminopeptidase
VIAPGADEETLAAAVLRGRIQGEAVNFARGLSNEPGNVLTPAEFASRVSRAVAGTGLAIDVLDEEQLHQLGLRLLLAVARGSAEPPRLMVLRHEPSSAPASPVLALVGKGVTFDSGGISIKPADGMERMKGDMAGGAAVAAAMRAIALLGGGRRVVGIIPATENMPGGRATRPGDVIAGASGTTVEIINTDAEGRLILADALWYAGQLGATHLVDVATLTGACVVALGRWVSGLFGAPGAWVETVRRAADRAGDRVWPMPIYEEAREELRSEIADLVNSAGRQGGAITGAAFLREFAAGRPWAHLDIAGTAWVEERKPYQPKGATGAAVRLLTELATSEAPWDRGRTD